MPDVKKCKATCLVTRVVLCLRMSRLSSESVSAPPLSPTRLLENTDPGYRLYGRL